MIGAAWPWLALVLLGAWHGLNPAMGWLFSVALGLQRRSRRAVFGALVPIALGHALAIGMIVLLVYAAGAVISFRSLQIAGAVTLLMVALWKLWRARHPTWVGTVRQFLGSDSLVLADGERPWSRPHGGAGPSWSEIDFLRTRTIQRKFTAPVSTIGCHRGGRRSYGFTFSHLRTNRLDRL
jgi:hypothetical protein